MFNSYSTKILQPVAKRINPYSSSLDNSAFNNKGYK